MRKAFWSILTTRAVSKPRRRAFTLPQPITVTKFRLYDYQRIKSRNALCVAPSQSRPGLCLWNC